MWCFWLFFWFCSSCRGNLSPSVAIHFMFSIHQKPETSIFQEAWGWCPKHKWGASAANGEINITWFGFRLPRAILGEHILFSCCRPFSCLLGSRVLCSTFCAIIQEVRERRKKKVRRSSALFRRPGQFYSTDWPWAWIIPELIQNEHWARSLQEESYVFHFCPYFHLSNTQRNMETRTPASRESKVSL